MPNKDSKCVCCHCGESLSKSHFFKSYSDVYKENLLPICKDCFSRKFGYFLSVYQNSKKAMKRMCMLFDIYFDEDLFDKCDIADDNTVLGNYFRKINMVQYKGKTFENSLENGFNFSFYKQNEKVQPVTNDGSKELVEDEPQISEKDIAKWGFGFESTDYEILNQHYKYLKTANPNCDSNQEIFIKDLCYTEMQKMKALRESRVDDYNKLTESYRKSFKQAGLKTTQEDMKTADDCWSTFVGIVSQYTPEEYYKNKDRYRDHDGLGEYYERMAIRPLRNLQLGTQDRDFEFYVHEEDDESDG